MTETQTAGAHATSGAPRSVAEALGQITWLVSQSPLHRNLSIGMLEQSFMPPIVKEQFRIFRFGPLPGGEAPSNFQAAGLSKAQIEQMPLGVAVWAHLNEDAEHKLERREPLQFEDWSSGKRTWLIEMISPYATPANKLTEVMLTDLVAGPFANKPFKLHRTDTSGQREAITIDQHLRG